MTPPTRPGQYAALSGDAGDDLAQQAELFAYNLTTSVAAVAGDGVDPFSVSAAAQPDGKTRVVVRQAERGGVTLTVDRVPILRLTASFNCTWDHRQLYLAVENSEFKVFATAGGSEPLFRYDYVREPRGVPSAHLQVHAHRDALTFVMARCGNSSRRAKTRAEATDVIEEVPQTSDLHFPLGGSRFRPCIEDVLEMLLDEFGLDTTADARDILQERREHWRRTQIAACARDSPEDAAQALRELGYDVQPPANGAVPSARTARLRER